MSEPEHVTTEYLTLGDILETMVARAKSEAAVVGDILQIKIPHGILVEAFGETGKPFNCFGEYPIDPTSDAFISVVCERGRVRTEPRRAGLPRDGKGG